MSLPIKAIDRLFERMALTYGRQWSNMYEGQPLNDVKTLWAHELAGFNGRLECVAWALDNLPDRAPNIIEFRKICRAAPQPETPQLPEPKADPARVNAELSKLRDVVNIKPRSTDGKDWARRIIANKRGGMQTNPTSLLFARQALGEA
jgi:hypothetical protein